MGKFKKKSRSRSSSNHDSERDDLKRRLRKLEIAMHGHFRNRSRSRSTNQRSRSRQNSGSVRSPRSSCSRGSTRDRSPIRGSTPDHTRTTDSISPELSHTPQIDSLTEDILVINNEVELDEATLEILGDDPENKKGQTIELHTALVSRWKYILTKGLSKESRSEISNRYPFPSNCIHLNAPKLNPEVQQMLLPLSLKRDRYQMLSQQQLGAGITALGTVINTVLKESNLYKPLLPGLTDAGKLLTDLHYNLSISRRSWITPQLNKDVKQLAVAGEIDQFLYGSDFQESCKRVKDLKRSSNELKADSGQGFKKPKVSTYKNVKPDLNRRGPFRTLGDSKQQGQTPPYKRTNDKYYQNSYQQRQRKY